MRCSIWRRSSPRQYAPAACSSLKCYLRRSEEHTSELQSPCNLVCRLLLEKKKIRTLSVMFALSTPATTFGFRADFLIQTLIAYTPASQPDMTCAPDAPRMLRRLLHSIINA